jgi:hypothetical protein
MFMNKISFVDYSRLIEELLRGDSAIKQNNVNVYELNKLVDDSDSFQIISK